MACDSCWEMRHCRGRNCQDCSVCQDIREDRWDMQRRTRLKPKRKERGTGTPRGPRPYVPRNYPELRKVTVAVDPLLRDAVLESLKDGSSVTQIMNRLNLTRAQIETIKDHLYA